MHHTHMAESILYCVMGWTGDSSVELAPCIVEDETAEGYTYVRRYCDGQRFCVGVRDVMYSADNERFVVFRPGEAEWLYE